MANPQRTDAEGEADVADDWAASADRLYDAALDDLLPESLVPFRGELVALSWTEASMGGGGFLSFLGEGDEADFEFNLGVLAKVGATDMRDLLVAMYQVIAPYRHPQPLSASEIDDRLTPEERARLRDLEERFWDYPDDLARLVVEHYGSV